MSLLDAYGLSLMSVEAWGCFAVISLASSVADWWSPSGASADDRCGDLICNALNWTICSVFTLQSSIPLLFWDVVWMSLMPAIEAAEQTVLSKVVPYEKQGRVFGFAQTQSAASPFLRYADRPGRRVRGDPVHDRRSGEARSDRRVVRRDTSVDWR